VLNKIDLLDDTVRDQRVEGVRDVVGRDVPHFAISAYAGDGVGALVRGISDWLAVQPDPEPEPEADLDEDVAGHTTVAQEVPSVEASDGAPTR
jgi:hypothetical protein